MGFRSRAQGFRVVVACRSCRAWLGIVGLETLNPKPETLNGLGFRVLGFREVGVSELGSFRKNLERDGRVERAGRIGVDIFRPSPLNMIPEPKTLNSKLWFTRGLRCRVSG